MIDLHIHLLPGVDDGPTDLAEAIAMCRLAAEDGCTHVVATPHQRCEGWWNTDRQLLEGLFEELRSGVDGVIDVRLGGEIRVDHDFFDDLRSMPESGLLPLAGSRYLLVELDRYGFGPEPEPVVDEVLAAGWRPVLAHPEFVPQLADDPARVARLVEVGAVAQLTAASVLGRFGRRAQRCTHRLIDDGLAGIVASDAHGTRWRRPGLREVDAYLRRSWDDATADALLRDHPAAVLRDAPLSG